jgi:hypothetical protein
LAILIGDLRRTDATSHHRRRSPLDRNHLTGIIVKAQHWPSSNRTQYGGAFVPILHETLTIFRRPRT